MRIFTVIIILICVLFNYAKAQNITNVLGTGGTYSVKSSSADFFTVSQSTGNVKIYNSLRLETTTGSGVGVLYMGADRFMHNYGFGCTFLGQNSGNYTSSFFNTAVGQLTLFSNNGGSSNAVMGYLAMGFNTTGTNNSVFGYAPLFFNSTGNGNSAFGNVSLVSNTVGIYNSAFGDSSLVLNSTGDSNSAFGHQSLSSNTTGSQNSAFGFQSMFSNTTGSFNTAIGRISGSNITTGNNLTCIGYASQPTIGTASNQFTLGNNTLQSLRCNVTSITSLSDRRDKKNIIDLPLGLEFIMKLKPRVYNWDKREWYENNVSDGSKMQVTPTAGFIAQELDEAETSRGALWLNLVNKDNPEKWEATPGNLMPVLVKALQDLKEENEKLKQGNDEIETENNELEKLLTQMEQQQNILAAEIEITKLRTGTSKTQNTGSGEYK